MIGLVEDDAPLFAEEPPVASAAPPWKILIVDDDKAIHAVTEMALGASAFHGRPVAWLHAYSGEDAVRVMREHDDVALVLMDVVMETDSAGLDAAQRIRQELGNHLVRIAVRTGQAGIAHEQTVVTQYGIDDYREKTDLTATRLFTLVHTSLAHYQQLWQLEHTGSGLRRVLDATNSVFALRTVASFSEGLLHYLSDLLYRKPRDVPMSVTAVAVEEPAGAPARVSVATGPSAPKVGQPLAEIADAEFRERLEETLQRRTGSFDPNGFSSYFRTGEGDGIAVYLTGANPISADGLGLAVLFCRNIAAALENRQLQHGGKEPASNESVVALSGVLEARSRETGNHVRRVAEYSRLLAQLAGLDPGSTHLLYLAAPLHDAGKLAIPDAVLHKAGPHDEAEASIMRSHAELGRQMFTRHESPVLQAAAVVAGQHHERWDGRGYPNGLRGEDIHIYGRITAIADVFDALTHPRCYKDAWPLKRALEYLSEESGTRFDPSLVDLFMQNLDQFIAIHNRFRDPEGTVH